MALLATQLIALAGLEDALTAAAGGGDTFVPDSRSFLRIANGAGAPITVTIVTAQTHRGVAIADIAVVVTNGETRMIGPFPADLFASSGVASITYSSATDVTVGIFNLTAI